MSVTLRSVPAVLARVLDRFGMPNFATDVRGGVRAWAANDLSGWHPAHRRADSGVWAIRPPCGRGVWRLYRPGSQRDGQGFSRVADVAAWHVADERHGGDSDLTVLADVRWWMEPWVAQVAGAPVVEMVEGWSEPYGPEDDRGCEYVIYALTGAPASARREET